MALSSWHSHRIDNKDRVQAVDVAIGVDIHTEDMKVNNILPLCLLYFLIQIFVFFL